MHVRRLPTLFSQNVITWKACFLNAFFATLFVVIVYIRFIFSISYACRADDTDVTSTVWSLPAIFLRTLLKVVKDAGFVEE